MDIAILPSPGILKDINVLLTTGISNNVPWTSTAQLGGCVLSAMGAVFHTNTYMGIISNYRVIAKMNFR